MDDEQRQLVTLTSHGIRLLQQKNHRQSSQCMLKALNYVKESSKKRTLSRPMEEEDVAQPPSNGFCFHAISFSPSSSTECSLPSPPLGRDDPTNSLPFQMFDRIFAFTNATTSPLDQQNRDGASAMLLYNLGVINHSRAMDARQQRGVPTKLSLRKALQMYTWALSAVQHWGRNYNKNVHDGCHLLRLAILNNLAHIHALLGATAKAEHCLKCLRDILGYAKGYLSRAEYAFFTANIVVLCLRKSDGDISPSSNNSSNVNNDLLTSAPAPAA